MTAERVMLDLLPLARGLACVPVSKFPVGAVVRGASGALYPGANIEIPGEPLNCSVHAEQAAVANAYSAGEKAITAIAVTAAPCGHCRQFLYEMVAPEDLAVCINGIRRTLAALLPQPFGPMDLRRKRGAFPIHKTRLKAGAGDALSLAALNAARKSYSPYTGSPSGAAIRCQDGRIFAGSYIENAAFNPSLSPFSAALAGFLASGGHLSQIRTVTLVEIPGATVRQADTIRRMLKQLAPRVRLNVLGAAKL